MNLLTTLLAFAVTLGILVVIHEFGHYWVARKCGVKVLNFSIGFGKPLFVWKNPKDPDQVEWRVSAIPLGGYVRMLDERDESCLPIKPEDAKRTFNSKNVWQKFAIVAAGPASNLLLAILLYSIIFFVGTTDLLPVVKAPLQGTPAAYAAIEDGDKILAVDGKPVGTFSDMRLEMLKHAGQVINLEVESSDGNVREKRIDLAGLKLEEEEPGKDSFADLGVELKVGDPYIRDFVSGSVAEKAGLKKGDTVLAIDGKKITDIKQLVNLIREYPNREATFTVLSADGKKHDVTFTPLAVEDENGKQIGRIGAVFGVDLPKTTVSYGLFRSVWEGAKKTWDTAVFSVEMIWKMLTGEVSVKNISGPVTIADYAGQTARLGLEQFISFLALVSISLGILNLLPIPMLDGGHLLYYSVEIVTGRPVSERVQMAAQKVGIAVLCGLMFLALFNDLNRLMP